MTENQNAVLQVVLSMFTSRWRSPAGRVRGKAASRYPAGPAMTAPPRASSGTPVCWSADRADHRHRCSSATPATSPGNTHTQASSPKKLLHLLTSGWEPMSGPAHQTQTQFHHISKSKERNAVIYLLSHRHTNSLPCGKIHSDIALRFHMDKINMVSLPDRTLCLKDWGHFLSCN